VAVIHQTKEA